MREWLKAKGRKDSARVLAMYKNTRLCVAGEHPYRIKALWIDPKTQETRELESHNIWGELKSEILEQQVDFYMHPKNKNCYLLDINKHYFCK